MVAPEIGSVVGEWGNRHPVLAEQFEGDALVQFAGHDGIDQQGDIGMAMEVDEPRGDDESRCVDD